MYNKEEVVFLKEFNNLGNKELNIVSGGDDIIDYIEELDGAMDIVPLYCPNCGINVFVNEVGYTVHYCQVCNSELKKKED